MQSSGSEAPVAIVFMRNVATARKAAQVIQCAGMIADVVAQPEEARTRLRSAAPPALLCLPGEELAAFRADLAACESEVLVLVEEPQHELYATILETPNVVGVAGLRYPGAPPRPWELLAISRRISAGRIPPPQSVLSWGSGWDELTLTKTEDREAAAEQLAMRCSEWQLGRQSNTIAQIADELIMNAMYDAPADENGQPRFAHRRKERIQLESWEQPMIGFGCDGTRVVLSAIDPFGRLGRSSVFGGLHRALTTRRMDTSGGGAGLGLAMIHQAAKVLFFDVLPGVRTQVTAIFELDVPPRHMRKIPTSVHYFQH